MRGRNGATQMLFGVAAFIGCLGVAELVRGGEPRPRGQGRERSTFENRRQTLRRQLDVELEALTRICRLQDSQRKKLEIAARGVVEQVLEQENELEAGRNVDGWHWREEGRVPDRAELLAHPLWRHTLQDVLSGVQAAALELERRSGKRFRREASIQLASGILQLELRLSDGQRKEVADLLQRTMAESFCEPALEAEAYTHWLDRDEVRKVLTKAQFAQWEDLRRAHRAEEDPFLNR